MRRAEREPSGSRLETSSRVRAERSMPRRIVANRGGAPPDAPARGRASSSAVGGVGDRLAHAEQQDRDAADRVAPALDLDALDDREAADGRLPGHARETDA